MNYTNVEVVLKEDKNNVERVINVLSGINPDPDSKGPVLDIPEVMVNLEVWVPPNSDTVQMTKDRMVKNCGRMRSPIRFGWHIPKELIKPIINYDSRWTAETGIVPWSFFKDANFSSQFHIDDKREIGAVKENNKIKCDDDYCAVSVSNFCNGTNKCATVLLSNSENVCPDFHELKESKMLIELIYLGSHFNDTINKIKTNYIKNNISKSFILSTWTPSELKLSNDNYVKIAFKNDMLPFGCSHETMKIEKFAWEKLETVAPSAYKAIMNMQFTDEEFQDLLKIYSEYRNKTYEDMACIWLRGHESYKAWYPEVNIPAIYIGGIFPIKQKSYQGSSIIASADRAIAKINSNQTILSGYTLKLLKHDGQCNAEKVMRSFIDYVGDPSYYDRMVGILGPACSDTVEQLAGISKHYKTIMISYGAEGASFSNRDKYPYFFRTIASNDEFKYVYLKLMQKFRWKRLATLTEDGQKYTEYILHTQNLLEDHGITVILNAKFARDQKDVSMKKYLKDIKSKGAKIIIADIFDSVARSVLCHAVQLDMTLKHGYVWFLPTWLDDIWYNTTLYNSKYKENVPCTTEVMMNAIDGYFSLSPSFWGKNNSVIPENITVSEWLRNVRGDGSNGSKELSNYAGFAYDAIWTYALALDKVLKSNPEAVSALHSNETTAMLVEAIKSMDFMGLSGRINFRGGSSRYSTIDLNQWTKEMNTTKVGSFQPKFENSSGELILNETAIKWFEGIPNDGSVNPTKCSLESFAKSINVGCEMAIVIVCFIVFSSLLTLLALWIFSYKFKVDTKIIETQKIIKSLGLVGDEEEDLPDLDKFVISKNNVIINRKLGQGSFGNVYGGEALIPEEGWMPVAVKTLRASASVKDKLRFLNEAETLGRFDHKNIIKLIGVSMDTEPVYKVIEFMLHGDLKTYLLARRNCSPGQGDHVSNKQLTSMALDVARALSYLTEMKYVHKDVCCKNCFINAEKLVKLGDFNMASGGFQKAYKRNALPVRWMAPESLSTGLFTPTSDIWSYGVLLYEIITFGGLPYKGMSNKQVVEHVNKGHTLDLPRGINPQLEALLRTCWLEDYKKRPRALDLVVYLEKNPELVSACTEGSSSSVVIDDDQGVVHFPKKIQSSSCVTFSNPTFNKSDTISLPYLRKDFKSEAKNYYSSMVPFKYAEQQYKTLIEETNI